MSCNIARDVQKRVLPLGRVLVVDDEPALLAVYRRILSQRALFTPATSAEAAVDRLLAGLKPRVVVSDYHLPGRNGLWLLSEVRRLCPAARRVLASGGAIDSLADHLRSKTVDVFLRKPFSPDDLFRALEAPASCPDL